MPTMDLSGMKADMESASIGFSKLSGDLSSLTSGFASKAIPEIGKISDLLPDVTGSLSRAAASIGDTINGESITALPKMKSMLEGLVPDTSQLKDLCDVAKKKIEAGVAAVAPGVTGILGQLKALGEKVDASAKAAIATMDAESFQAPSEASGLLNNIDSIATTMGKFASDVGKYVFDPDSGPAPHFSQVIDSIKIDQLLTTANNVKGQATGFAAGAVTSNLYKAAGILKEASLRIASKAALYQKAELELGAMSDQISADVAIEVNRVRGSSPEQNVGI